MVGHFQRIEKTWNFWGLSLPLEAMSYTKSCDLLTSSLLSNSAKLRLLKRTLMDDASAKTTTQRWVFRWETLHITSGLWWRSLKTESPPGMGCERPTWTQYCYRVSIYSQGEPSFPDQI
jgi:hypothetical protein